MQVKLVKQISNPMIWVSIRFNKYNCRFLCFLKMKMLLWSSYNQKAHSTNITLSCCRIFPRTLLTKWTKRLTKTILGLPPNYQHTSLKGYSSFLFGRKFSSDFVYPQNPSIRTKVHQIPEQWFWTIHAQDLIGHEILKKKKNWVFLVFPEREAPKYLNRPICIIRHSSRKSIREFINACPFWLLENQLKDELD